MNSRRFLTLTCIALLLLLAAPALAAATSSPDEIADSDITLAIERELITQRGVSLDGMDVTTQQGVVTLAGTVDHLMAKERAANIASMIKGVRSVVNRLDVKKVELEDRQLASRVQQALLKDPATDSWEIKVRAEDSKVFLSGTVDSWHEKQLASHVAQATPGVSALENQLDINFESPRSDYELRTEIEQSLKWDARVRDALIEVNVSQGKVALSGAVGSAYERSLASADSWVRGVQAVDDSQLEVQWWARNDMQRLERFKDRSDADVKAAIQSALLYDPRVNSFAPALDVDQGTVTLTGVVDNLKAKQAAGQDAANTVGVWSVHNLLKVRPMKARADHQIAADAVAQLAADPYVESYEMSVDIDNGVARLDGWVDSYFEKAQAAEIVAEVQGVVRVENRLRVQTLPMFDSNGLYAWDPLVSTWAYSTADRFKSDQTIHSEIESQLWWSPFVDQDDVNVKVSDGVATLTGTVDSWAERLEASEQALEGGALKVDNNLVVEPGYELPSL